MKLLIRCLTLVGALAAAVSALAQGGLDRLFGDGPASMPVSELPESFRAYEIRLSGVGESMGWPSMFMLGMSGGNDRAPLMLLRLADLYWTDGKTLGEGDGLMLATYKLDISFAGLIAAEGRLASPLAMRRVMVRVGAIDAIGPVPSIDRRGLIELERMLRSEEPGGIDAAGVATPEEAATGPRPAADAAQTLSSIKQVALAAIMYANDYDDVFPYVQSTSSAQSVLLPYVKNPTTFFAADGRTRFVFNMAVAGVEMPRIERPGDVVLWYEERPASDGRRAVAFADGSARRLGPEEWREAERTLRLKLPKTGRPLPADWMPTPIPNPS